MAVAIADRQRRVRIAPPRLRRAAGRALAAVGRPAGGVEIDVVDDRRIRELNHRFRGVRRRTDVLAFPWESEGRPGSAGASPSVRGVKGGPSSPPFVQLLGQIVISAETAARQARRLGVPRAMEMDLLVTHGILHLVGYDDRDPVEADLMHRRARAILSASGQRIPYTLWRGLLPSERRLRRRNPSRQGTAPLLQSQRTTRRAVGGVGEERRSLPPTFNA